ncbi:hypothetical protein, partial [Fischerella thermalis]|uniref:hypothetical protein n=1 Tax=Fischerella thermalis TaxID=372787 RepID=UPI001CA4D8AE
RQKLWFIIHCHDPLLLGGRRQKLWLIIHCHDPLLHLLDGGVIITSSISKFTNQPLTPRES